MSMAGVKPSKAKGRPGLASAICKKCSIKFEHGINIGQAKKYCDLCKKLVVRENKARWSAANKERENEMKSLYKKKPHVKKLTQERHAEWRKTPAGKVKTRQQLRLRYSGLRNAAIITRSNPELKKQVDAIYAKAVETGMTVDHIYPLKHPRLCGLHVPWNLQLLTLEDNSRKRNTLPATPSFNYQGVFKCNAPTVSSA